ncbi:MAG: hypothetical protein H6Q98_57 [Nitrospirae bacterium]|nr:hypothetical protein [Nitrospirota bacterium]
MFSEDWVEKQSSRSRVDKQSSQEAVKTQSRNDPIVPTAILLFYDYFALVASRIMSRATTLR